MKLKRSGAISVIMVALIVVMLALPLTAYSQLPAPALFKGDVVLNGETLAPGPNVRISVDEPGGPVGVGTADGFNYYEVSIIGQATDNGKPLNFELNIDGMGWVPANWICVDCTQEPPVYAANVQQEIDLSVGAPLPQVSFAAANVNVNEGDWATVEVVLSGTSADTVTVQYNTADIGDATLAIDYNHATGTLTFVPGDVSETFQVQTIQDDKYEPANEVFNVVLMNPNNAVLGAPNPATVTILDDDPVPPMPDVFFAADNYAVNEGDAQTIQVLLSGTSTDTITVEWSTTDVDHAVAGVDYTQDNGVVTFNPGEDSKTFQVNTIEDPFLENDKVFGVILQNPVNANLGDPAQTNVTILDDDVADAEWLFGADHAPLIAPFPNNGRVFLGGDVDIDQGGSFEGDWFQILKYDENNEVPGCDWLIYVSGLANDGDCSLTTLETGEYYYVVVSDMAEPLQLQW